MKCVVREFEEIQIDGAGLTGLDVVPLKKIYLTIFTFAETLDDKSAGREFNIQFNKIVDFSLDMEESWCRVISHSAFSESELLSAFKARPVKFPQRVDRDKLHHFQLILDHGQIDVIAESFSCMLVWEVQ